MHAPYPSFAAIELTGTKLKEVSNNKGIKIRRLEFVSASGILDKNLAVWIFYETNAELTLRTSDGTNEKLKTDFLDELKKTKNILPFDAMPEAVVFKFDSHDNVILNYKGSYFLRLR